MAPWEVFLFRADESLSKRDFAATVAASGAATGIPALFVCVFVRLFRRNVELKKVNSKYILKSTLTPQLSRKQFHASTSSIERCQSWPNVVQTDSNSEMYYLGPVSARSGRTFVALWAWLTVCPLIRQSTLYSRISILRHLHVRAACFHLGVCEGVIKRPDGGSQYALSCIVSLQTSVQFCNSVPLLYSTQYVSSHAATHSCIALYCTSLTTDNSTV